MPNSLIEQIDRDIAEAERLITELRLQIAISQSAGEDTSDRESRLQHILMGSMLLHDQRQKAGKDEPIIVDPARPFTLSPASDLLAEEASKDEDAV